VKLSDKREEIAGKLRVKIDISLRSGYNVLSDSAKVGHNWSHYPYPYVLFFL